MQNSKYLVYPKNLLFRYKLLTLIFYVYFAELRKF